MQANKHKTGSQIHITDLWLLEVEGGGGKNE